MKRILTLTAAVMALSGFSASASVAIEIQDIAFCFNDVRIQSVSGGQTNLYYRHHYYHDPSGTFRIESDIYGRSHSLDASGKMFFEGKISFRDGVPFISGKGTQEIRYYTSGGTYQIDTEKFSASGPFVPNPNGQDFFSVVKTGSYQKWNLQYSQLNTDGDFHYQTSFQTEEHSNWRIVFISDDGINLDSVRVVYPVGGGGDYTIKRARQNKRTGDLMLQVSRPTEKRPETLTITVTSDFGRVKSFRGSLHGRRMNLKEPNQRQL